MNKQQPLLEGFWYSKSEPWFPMPEAKAEQWPRQPLFLEMLIDVERKADQQAYRGWSTCRCCGANVGHISYLYKGWEWPMGLRHYIEEHNVRPSTAFMMMVMGDKFTDVYVESIESKAQRRAVEEILEDEDNAWLRTARASIK